MDILWSKRIKKQIIFNYKQQYQCKQTILTTLNSIELINTSPINLNHKHPKNKYKKNYYTRKITPEYMIRNSVEYREWRFKVYERDNHTCQICGKKKRKMNAHHIYGFASHPTLRLELDNGITLCSSCHWKFHKKYGKENFPNILNTEMYLLGYNKFKNTRSQLNNTQSQFNNNKDEDQLMDMKQHIIDYTNNN